MNNLFFKSANRLIKNDSINLEALDRVLKFIQTEQRHQRQDLRDISRKIDRLLIDKHLQMQVDTYFDDNAQNIPDSDDLD